MASTPSNKDLIDFSQPWDLSDAVLVVQDSRFHVHRCVLAMWSPVFSRMFQSEFKERTKNEIPLPGKTAAQVRELLLVIYPTSSKSIDEKNYVLLIDLAREYMMAKLTERCENYLLSIVTVRNVEPSEFQSKPVCLDLLGIAQEYKLERLRSACIEAAQDLSLYEMQSHDMYSYTIDFPTYRQIVEGKMDKMEKQFLNCSFCQGNRQRQKTVNVHQRNGAYF
ncbi:BTB and MATH domain-containing protein 36-like [Montipora capricornis]|uniref:BTB and MATH domain-containing protein 36-like n=1 Tax=Montipora foliosa TaxID=591990 RepID=UPI0035F11FCE